MKNILLVDDDKDLSQSLANLFDSDKFRFQFLDDGTDVAEFVKDHNDLDLIMLDVNLPTMSGLEVLRKIKETKSAPPVIVISGFVSTENAMEAMREGAFEYLTKPFDIEKLINTVNKACLQSSSVKSPFVGIAEETGKAGNYEIIGNSLEIVEIAKLVGQVSGSDAAALIFGESGTGKELVARAIHRNSKRRSEAFVSVNCAALHEALLESELFGHEKGAFTGAYFKRIGRFEQADGGTLFLDEIGDMSMLTQSKLLRVLQEKKLERVGGNDSINVDVRIVAATNKSLVQLMKEGSFRVDLFYRLKVFSLYIPPLRERCSDIPLLVEYFTRKFARQLDRPARQLSKKALQEMMRYQWPGNVRELENNIHTAMVMAKGNYIEISDLPAFTDTENAPQASLSDLQDNYQESFHKLIEPIMPGLMSAYSGKIYHLLESAFERAVISTCLKRLGGNQVKTSATLGISRNTLRDRISRYEIF